MSESKKYKIGAISKMLGIPIQTLHYYEKCGFVSPQKDNDSNYRYYDAWDVNFLLDYKFLKSFEFSNAEIGQIINKDDIESIHNKFENQEEKLIEKIHHYQDVLAELNTEKRKLEVYRSQLNQFTEVKNPPLFYKQHRYKDEYMVPQIGDWLSLLPFVSATFKVSLDSISEPDYWWGYSLSTRKAKDLNVPTSDAEFIPSKRCIYTVFSAMGQHTFASALQQQVLEPIRLRGHQISDDPIGRLIIRAYEKNVYVRYFEIWIPVH